MYLCVWLCKYVCLCNTFKCVCFYVNLGTSSSQLLSHEDLQRGRPSLHFTSPTVWLTFHSPQSPVVSPVFSLLLSVCMFLEDSVAGRTAWRQYFLSLLSKVSELLGVALRQDALRDGPLCYTAVKVHGEQGSNLEEGLSLVMNISLAADLILSFPPAQVCLQTFQLLSSEVAPLVWDEASSSAVLQEILQALVDLVFGEVCQKYINNARISLKLVLEIQDWCSCSQQALSFCWNVLPCSAATGTRVFWQALLCPCWSTRHQRVALQERLPGVCCRSLTLVGHHSDGTGRWWDKMRLWWTASRYTDIPDTMVVALIAPQSPGCWASVLSRRSAERQEKKTEQPGWLWAEASSPAAHLASCSARLQGAQRWVGWDSAALTQRVSR